MLSSVRQTTGESRERIQQEMVLLGIWLGIGTLMAVLGILASRRGGDRMALSRAPQILALCLLLWPLVLLTVFMPDI